MKTCIDCRKMKPDTEYNDTHGSVCFGCRVKTVNLGFTYGREAFHGPTTRELVAQAYSDAAASGEKIIPRTTVGASSLPSGSAKKLAAHLNAKAV